MSFIGALGNNTDDNNYNFNFNDIKIRIVDVDTSNYARFLDYNSSNYTDEIAFGDSNYTDVIGLNSSNYTDVIGLNSSNYTDVIDIYSSNYTKRINEELSDRIGFPASLFPVELPTGVYIPIKVQELEIAEVAQVVGLHTIAIGGIEEQILALVGTGGIIGIITGGAVGTAISKANTAQTTAENAQTTADAAQTTANTAQSTANTAQSTAETATITAEETQTIAEDALNNADIALSIWNKGTDYPNNIYHLQTGNVGIGVPNNTELTNKLVVNGTTKMNDNLFLNGGDLNIRDTNSTTWINFYNYSNTTTIKEQAYIYLSEISDVFAIDRVVLSTRTTPAIELRCSGDPIIQVYRDKVDITKNLNVAGDITFTGNLYDTNGIFTSGGGGTTYDDDNRLNYKFLKEPIKDAESIVNIQEPIIIQDANIQEPTIDLVIQEPTSSPSVSITTIDSDYKYMAFTYTTGTNNTVYNITFNDNTECDILMIGAGGGGGHSRAGGAGSGACLVYKNYVMNGTYNILVGKGSLNVSGDNGLNGNDSAITNSGGDIFLAKGGGGGGANALSGLSGGCGGGTSSQANQLGGEIVSTNKILGVNTAPSFNANYIIYGNIGGRNTRTWNGNLSAMDSAGGGGIGEGGTTSGTLNAVDSQFNPNNPGKGGDGRYFATINGIDYNFKDYFGIVGVEDGSSGNFFIGGGGGGGDNSAGSNGIGGKGGGGLGGDDNGDDNAGSSGITNTGSGGGGGGGGGNLGGGGGSGIVVIRYRYTRPSAPQVQTINSDYKYFSFPQLNTALYSTTLYSMNFFENTEVELLILDNAFFKIMPAYVVIPAGKINIYVGGVGSNSSFGDISTVTETTPYFSCNSPITGTIVTYNDTIVIVRYKYTRTQIQPITINSNYKYISFPNTGANQTAYSINFQEQTEIQLLILDNLRYITVSPFTTNGQTTINVGSPSTFNTLTTNTNSTFYNFTQGHFSTITGSSIGYNAPVVIVRYKYTKIVIIQVPSYGFLKYNEDNVWGVSNTLPKINGDLTLNGGDLNIRETNGTTWVRFLNYSDATTVKEEAYIFLSEFSDVLAIDRNVLDTRTTSAIEIRVGGIPIIQVFRDKVDITKNLNVIENIAGKEYKLSNGVRFAYSSQSENPLRADTSRGLECEHFDGTHIRGVNYYGINCIGNLSTTGTKQFKIPHPILENKSLIHNSVESPRVENLYRGIKQLINGKCEINIDTDCNENGGLTEGTFESFNRHSQLFLQNHNTFDRLKGIITGNKISVRCEDVTANYEINWMVISERCDKNIMEATTTDENGRLLCEVENTDTGAEKA